MFLKRLQQENKPLIDLCFKWHQEDKIEPDTYVIDVDRVCENAQKIQEEANKYDIELFVMTKQFGRNPYIARKLVEMGYKGVVAVDYKDAKVMMKHHIPLSHIGHLVQLPKGKIQKIMDYGVDYITIYSIEKARAINQVAGELGIIQHILIKVIADTDRLYPAQEGGFLLQDIEEVANEIKEMSGIHLAGVTVFPAMLYDKETNQVLSTPNVETLKAAANKLEKVLGYAMKLNMPSCTQTSLMQTLYEQGANQAEPGSSLIGMTPNKGEEKLALAYVSEISHHYSKKSMCYGGGIYRRGVIEEALVGCSSEDAVAVDANNPQVDAIDYHIELMGNHPVGYTVVMCYRTQIFVTRSKVLLIEGLSDNQPRCVGVFDSQGRRDI